MSEKYRPYRYSDESPEPLKEGEDPYKLPVGELFRRKIVLLMNPDNPLVGLARDTNSEVVAPKEAYDADDFLVNYSDVINGEKRSGTELGSAVIDAVKQMETIYKSGVSLEEIQDFLRGYYGHESDIPPTSVRIARSLLGYYNHLAAIEEKPAFTFADVASQPVETVAPTPLIVETPNYNSMWTPEDEQKFRAEVDAQNLGPAVMPAVEEQKGFIPTRIPREQRAHRRSNSDH